MLKIIIIYYLVFLGGLGCSQSRSYIVNKNPARVVAGDFHYDSVNSEVIINFFKRNNLKFDDPARMYPPLPQKSIASLESRYNRGRNNPLKNDPMVSKWLRGFLGNKMLSNVRSSFKTEQGHYILINNRVYFKRPNYSNLVYVTPFSNKRFMSTSDGFGAGWTGAYEFYGDDTLPAKPNCDESDISLDSLVKIYEDPNVNNTYDFLNALPKDVLQKFTFIKESKSLQNQGVDKYNPRVLRFSTDGKMAMTYTCNPDTLDFNTIELMSFNENKRKYEFMHLSFPHTNHKNAKIFNRLGKSKSKNHLSCLGCHGGADPRPNWDEYDDWLGVYGSRDDRLGIKQANGVWLPKYRAGKHAEEVRKETSEYIELRKRHENNPCLSTLPWPSKDSDSYMHYPYIGTPKEMNYNFRPNAHFTIIHSRRNGQRLARKFQSHPVWNKIKYDVMLDSLNCYIYGYESEIDKYLDLNSNPPFYSEGSVYANSDSNLSRPKYSLPLISQALGFYSSDWTLNFNKGGPVESQTRRYQTAQWPMQEFVLSVLFRDMTKEIPSLKKYDLRVNRMTQQFGRKFMCVDEVADKLWLTDNERENSCKLIAQHKKNTGETPQKLNVKKSFRQTRDNSQDYKKVKVSLEMGLKVLQSRCASCHNGNVLTYNFLSEGSIKAQVLSLGFEIYSQRIKEMVGTADECEMPYSMMGKCLNKSERSSLLEYVNSLK